MTALRGKLSELFRLVGAEPTGDVLFVELRNDDFDKQGCPSFSADRLRALDEFSPRFEELLKAGFAWVNLSLLGSHGRWKVVGVEVPRDAVGADQPSVNLSGPSSLPLKVQGDFQ